MNRIEILRQAALTRTPDLAVFKLPFYRHYSQKQSYAEAFTAMFGELKPHITEGELIVGELGTLSDEERQEWNEKYRSVADAAAAFAGGGQDSHMAIDYELLLREGIVGIQKRIDRYLSECDADKVGFYRSCQAALSAVVVHANRYADEADAIASNTFDVDRKRELRRIAAVCRRVPEYPATSFYEAVQSVHFVSYCLTLNPFRPGYQQFQLGRPDRYLYPFYRHDADSGVLNDEEAQLLLDCLGIQINMRVPNGLSAGYMLGGRDEDGTVVANELTIMGMKVIDDIHLVYPSVGFCYAEGMPDKYLYTACEILLHGRSHPAIFNDDLIAKGLTYYGVSRPHSYIHSTCVEITPIAASNVWVASPYTNMPQILLSVMDREYRDLEELIQVYLERLDGSIRRNFEEQNRLRGVRQKNSCNPLLSCFVDDCLKRGVDIEKGGAVYNWIMPSFVGMANLVDSLVAIDTLVFTEKKLTVCGFAEILKNNFAGNEPLRQYILSAIPKYGNDDDRVDGLFGRFTEHLVAACEKYTPVYTNGRLIPSVFCWIMHERFGSQTGATPDGRTAGFPLGDGSGPCQGREHNGPTASILSSTKWSHEKLIGGVAVNMKFAKQSLGEHSAEILKNLVETYLARGGFEMQVNVVDRETLEAACVHPEDYADLVVRIGGYSDYFVRLPKGMQDEVILRTAHSL